MDAIPLPPGSTRAALEQLAEDLAAAARAGDPEVRTFAARWLRAVADGVGVEVGPFVQDSFDRTVDRVTERARAAITPALARSLVAEAHGFADWPGLVAHVETPGPFEAAADAVVAGDLPALEALLRRDPE